MSRRPKAPGFRLQDDTGEWVSLEELRGERVVLFFYPKDRSAGCTVEVCEFRDHFPRFEAHGVRVFGISPDSVRKHARFRSEQALPYPLLSDPDHATCEAYGVWHEKMFWGRRYMGVVRSTFAVAPDGRVEKEWRDVSHEGHAADVEAWLREARPTRGPAEAAARPAHRAAKKK